MSDDIFLELFLVFRCIYLALWIAIYNASLFGWIVPVALSSSHS